MSGPEFQERVLRADGSIDRDSFGTLWPSLRVMGRCSPQDKYTIVRGKPLLRILPSPVMLCLSMYTVNSETVLEALQICCCLATLDLVFVPWLHPMEVAGGKLHTQ